MVIVSFFLLKLLWSCVRVLWICLRTLFTFRLDFWSARPNIVQGTMSSNEEVVIAVLGVTGVGKSSFVQRVSNRNDVYVEDGLSSGTEDVRAYRFTHKGIDFVIVDTPGFNDSRNSDDGAVVDKLLAWLEFSYQQGTRLNGLVYLHRISDPRMPGTAMRNLSMFRRLCGSNNFANVVLGTTFWSKSGPKTGEKRERELKTSNEMWGSMLSKGSTVVRVLEDRSSNLTILEDIARNNGKVVIEAQKEMAAGKSRAQTTVALDLTKAVTEYRQQQQLEQYRETQRLAQEEEKRARARRKVLADLQAEMDQQRRAAEQAAAMEAQRKRQRNEQARQARLVEERKERELRQAEAARLEALAEQARQARQARALAEAWRSYYAQHVCAGTSTYRRHCDRCSVRLHKSRDHYWRECFLCFLSLVLWLACLVADLTPAQIAVSVTATTTTRVRAVGRFVGTLRIRLCGGQGPLMIASAWLCRALDQKTSH